MSKRLAVLEKMIAAGTKDPFAWYGLAMEYRTAGRLDDALATFEKLRALDALYVAQYLMCGQMLAEAGRAADARTWFDAGVVAARQKGDGHAASELESALASLSDD